MLNIYSAGENIDKERFIFDRIKSNEGNTILIVPDQFSAQTERNAFFYLGTKATMDLRILHFGRLGEKALEELGELVPPLIDKYGRHMLLTNIMRRAEKNEGLNTYKGMSEKNTFVTMMNSLISEMKRSEIVPDDLDKAIDVLDDNSFLKRKLADIKYIYSEYENEIKDKYIDSEDYVTFYGDALTRAPLAQKSKVWIYGFDTFTDRNIQVITRLVEVADQVNMVMNYQGHGQDAPDGAFLVGDSRDELFQLTGHVITKLDKACQGNVRYHKIENPERISIWNSSESWKTKACLVGASNVYEESERAAGYICSLVRDQGYRYGDIITICNDMSGLGAHLMRTFERWGIPAFVDKKRKVLHHPAVGFVIALLDIAGKGYRSESVMRLIKSGLMGVSSWETELLENYVLTFKIRGSMWNKPFVKQGQIASEKELETLNKLRETIVETVENAKNSMGARKTAGEKIRGLYEFLSDSFEINSRLEHMIRLQTDAGLDEAASETAQSWKVICNIFDQIIEIIGDKQVSNIELNKLIIDGLEEMEIGLVPAHSDSVIISTMQRTRLSRNKVLLVVGANEGMLPLAGGEEGLLNEQEIEKLDEMNLPVSKTDFVMRGEESLAIYRNLSCPEEKLYMSYSRLNSGGEVLKPSRVFLALADYIKGETGELNILGDLADEELISSVIGTSGGSFPFLAEAVRCYGDGEKIDSAWCQVINWYSENKPDTLDKMKTGITLSNELLKLDNDFADAIYMGDRNSMSVSASRLEKFSACPFAHFMNYGLRPQVLEQYEIGAKETGDIYHQCLMKFSQTLTDDKTPINDASSEWMTMDETRCKELIGDIIHDQLKDYREGIVDSGLQEKYRVDRIINICTNVAMSLVRQVQRGHIKSMDFERAFDVESSLKPIRIKVGDKEVVLRGIIDRMDIIDAGDNTEAVRIVDYKTGSTEIVKEHFEIGYKLQLMVYMNAALGNDEKLIPAGVFHFHINEMDEDDSNGKASREQVISRQDKNYRLKGFVLNEEKVIRATDGDFEKESNVIPVKINSKQEYAAAAKGKLFSREEFETLCETVNEQVERICQEIIDGHIQVQPRREGTKSACGYCDYRSVCLFDTSFEGCRYVNV